MLDFLAIINELMETAAKDVKRAANQVQKVAEDLENKAKSGHDVIDDTLSKGETFTKDVKEKGKAIVDTAQTATKDLKNELGAQAHDAADDAKERLLSRIRQVCGQLGGASDEKDINMHLQLFSSFHDFRRTHLRVQQCDH